MRPLKDSERLASSYMYESERVCVCVLGGWSDAADQTGATAFRSL